MAKILLIQGANMNLLGIREPDIYGRTTAAELDKMLQEYVKTKAVHLEIFYTNSEGECIDRIIQAYHENVDALVIFLMHHPFMDLKRVIRPVLRQRQLSKKPVILGVNALHGSIDEEVAELETAGIPVYSLPDRAIRALRGLIVYGEMFKKKGC